MRTDNCLNCSSELASSQRFCAQCGQKAIIHRITFPHFVHEFFHAFTHTDFGIFHLLKELTLRPGVVAREYVAGKRKKYFNPFTFFLLVMAFFVFTASLLTKSLPPVEPDPAIVAQIPTEAGKANYIAMMHRAGNAMAFMSKYSNVVGMIAVPFLSLITWLCFRRRGFNYGEHLTANLLFTSYNNFIYALFIIPLEIVFRSLEANQMIIGAGMIFHSIYLGWGLSGFLQMRGFRKRVLVYLVGLFATIMWVLLSTIAISVYIYQNKFFYQFLFRMLGIT